MPADANPEVPAAIAEALLRRALSPYHPVEQAVQDLHRAAELVPQDPRFHYHLGLAEHLAGESATASNAYARAAELGMSRQGLNYVRALAELERDPSVDLAALSWLGDDDRAALAPAQLLLLGKPDECLQKVAAAQTEARNATDSLAPVWTCLAQVQKQDAECAIAALSQSGQRPPRAASEVQHFYLGLAHAVKGDLADAERHWNEVARATGKVEVQPLPRFAEAMAWLQAHKLSSAPGLREWKNILDEFTRRGYRKDRDLAEVKLAAVAANRLAEGSRQANDWPAALGHWRSLRTMVSHYPQLGPAEPLLQNMAIAYERLEDWESAADSWSALLDATPRARGRKKDSEEAAIREARRAWLRKRVLDHLRKVGAADRAIEHFRQIVKAEPDNLELRLEMASALLANDQWLAARNEIDRILKKNPCFVEALLLRASIERDRWETHAMEMTLREAYRCDPAHPVARKALSAHLFDVGVRHFNARQYAKAKSAYAEAHEFDPTNTLVIGNLLQTELRLRNTGEFRKCLELGLAGNDLDGFADMLEALLVEGRQKEADEVIKRSEPLGFTMELLVETGAALLARFSPPIGIRLHPAGKGPEPPIVKTGRELIERGIAAAESESAGVTYAVHAIGPERLDIAGRYVERLVQLEPDEPVSQMMYGMWLASSGEIDRALPILEKAERLAQRKGDKELREQIANLRKDLKSPLGRFMPTLGGLPPEFLDDPDLLEEILGREFPDSFPY